MRFSAYFMALFLMGLLACVEVNASSYSAVVADVTTHLPPPHKKAVTKGCNGANCPTIQVAGLAADGGWTANANCSITLNAPAGMIGFLMYAAIDNGKHVGTFTVTQGAAQNFDAATPPGSTLQHSSAAQQNTLVATWTAPPPTGAQTAVTITALVMAPPASSGAQAKGNIITMTVQQSNAKPAVTTKAPATTPKPAATTTKPAPATTTTAAPVVNCFLTVPANALTAKGLATPWILSTDNTGNTPCTMANTGSQAFVQGAVINTDTGAISIYNPLVVTVNTKPAVAPTAPTLPANNVVATWVGFNGNQLTLKNAAGTQSVTQAKCVNGVNNSPFTQFAYCNAPAFFMAVQIAIENGQIATQPNVAAITAATGVAPAVVVPALGTASDGVVCPTLRNFYLVDMDQSDNLDVTYLVTAAGLTAQATAANMKALAGTTTAINPGDNLLLTTLVNPAIKCAPGLQAPDLANNNNPVNALPLSEIQATLLEGFPAALIPGLDPMVLVNGAMSLTKLNNYRAGVFQPLVNSLGMAATSCYCKNMVRVAPKRLMATSAQLALSNSFVAGQNLFQFLIARFQTAIGAGGLNCAQFGINVAAFSTNAVFMPAAANQHTDSNRMVEEVGVWYRVPNTNSLRMRVLDANNGSIYVNADTNVINGYDSLDLTSMAENMDHNNALGATMEAFADPAILITADAGTQNADVGVNPTTSDSTPFLQTTTGLAVIIGAGAAGLIAVIALCAFLYLRKRKHHSNTVATMATEMRRV